MEVLSFIYPIIGNIIIVIPIIIISKLVGIKIKSPVINVFPIIMIIVV